MAKGLRSKSKRANRTQLRKVLVEPIIRNRTEALSKKIEDNIAAKNTDSILKLTKVFNNNKKNKEDIMDEDDDDDDNDNDNDNNDDDDKKKAKSILLKDKLKKLKGSKPKTSRNQGKQLVWF